MSGPPKKLSPTGQAGTLPLASDAHMSRTSSSVVSSLPDRSCSHFLDEVLESQICPDPRTQVLEYTVSALENPCAVLLVDRYAQFCDPVVLF